MIENKDLIISGAQKNTKTQVELSDFLGDVTECAIEGGLEILSEAESDVVGEAAVEVAEGALETVGEGAAEGFLEGILDGLDDLPGLAIAAIAVVGIGLIAGIGVIGKKIIKKKK